ncbi:MAG TPA: MBL fold metallo-hydrolase [Tepidisphaeraceae bacterium]|jgi:glyoxylase-like metal-dependent hydrolase (beta-lactamase superfamily II)|nr:MBL fold metallo-hydrolase [Tepidisphaeraceae bacterium]
MKILMNTGGIAATNSFLVADEVEKKAVIFDAPDHTTSPLLDAAQKEGWDIIGLWLTHGHFDHVADHEVIRSRYPGAKVLIHKLDEPKLQKPGATFVLPIRIPPAKADGYVEDGQKLKLGRYEFEVIHTPGHAPGHVMYYCASEKVLIGGDLIIGGAVGRTDLPDSSYDDLVRSIQRVMKLPGDTKLLPGHGQISTLDEERENNPYVARASCP